MSYNNVAAAYQNNKIMTATPTDLTLMLYDGAIKFCNIAIVAIEGKDVQKANDNIIKAEKIITEFRSTLDFKYPVANDFENVYRYLFDRLVEANIKKDMKILEEVIEHLRVMRDAWKEVIRLNKLGK